MSLDSDLTTNALEGTIAKAVQVICVTVFFYYCALNFAKEKEYIWSKSWSAGKAMYLVTRYSGAAFLILVIISMFKLAWNDTGILPDAPDSALNAYYNPSYLCLSGYLYIGPGTFVILFAEIILQMRVYALYGRKKRILFLMIFLSFISLGVVATQLFGFTYIATGLICIGKACGPSKKRSLITRATPVFPCTASSRPISAVGWLVTSLVELILFIMVLRKTRQANRDRFAVPSTLGSRAKSQPRDITAVIARDSATYFAVIFTICSIGVCLSFITQIEVLSSAIRFIGSQMNAYQTVVLTIMTLLAPNLLINLRVECYGPSDAISLATWNVAKPEPVDTHGETGYNANPDVRESLLSSHERTRSELFDMQFPYHYSDLDSISTSRSDTVAS